LQGFGSAGRFAQMLMKELAISHQYFIGVLAAVKKLSIDVRTRTCAFSVSA
jgi:hypothetical protein